MTVQSCCGLGRFCVRALQKNARKSAKTRDENAAAGGGRQRLVHFQRGLRGTWKRGRIDVPVLEVLVEIRGPFLSAAGIGGCRQSQCGQVVRILLALDDEDHVMLGFEQSRQPISWWLVERTSSLTNLAMFFTPRSKSSAISSCTCPAALATRLTMADAAMRCWYVSSIQICTCASVAWPLTAIRSGPVQRLCASATCAALRKP